MMLADPSPSPSPSTTETMAVEGKVEGKVALEAKVEGKPDDPNKPTSKGKSCFHYLDDLDQGRQFGNVEDISVHLILDLSHFTWLRVFCRQPVAKPKISVIT